MDRRVYQQGIWKKCPYCDYITDSHLMMKVVRHVKKIEGDEVVYCESIPENWIVLEDQSGNY